MLVYLAARYSRYLEMQAVRADLEKLGHTITSRWINGGHQISDDGLSAQAKEAERIRFATEDLSDLEQASTIIAFTETPRSTASRGGRHVELGIAVGRRMRVIVVGPRENVFCCLPIVEWHSDYQSFIAAITGAALTLGSPAHNPQHSEPAIELLRYLFHYRLPLGNTVSDLMVEADDNKWFDIHRTLNSGCR